MLQFLGEVSLITGDELAELIGLTAGTSQFSTEPWLRFDDNGRDIYIAKKPYRYSVSWDALNTVGAVYGNKTVSIDGKLYMVRLIKGGNGDPTTGGTYYGCNITEHQGSEWNRYMYPIHSTTHVSSRNPNTSDMGTLAQYTDEDLHVHYDYGNGTYSWCQEVTGASASNRVLRGNGGVTYGNYNTSSSAIANRGWRPLLELINL